MITAEQFEEVKILAGLAYTPAQVGTALGIHQSQIEMYMLDPEDLFYQAYHSGWFDQDIKLRAAISKLAIAGSSPAQAAMLKIISKSEFQRS